MQHTKTQKLVLCALIAAGAFLKIPVPLVPFTLQFLFTMLAGLQLGGRLGAPAVCAHIALGLAGLPIFAQGGGLAYVFQPSFGYLLGFAAGAYATGTLTNRVPRPGFGRTGYRFVANLVQPDILVLDTMKAWFAQMPSE